MKRFCKKCLLAELDEDEYILSLKSYIAAYPEDKRAPEEIYNKRLSICRRCAHLSNGMCAKCGCYVELRALKKEQRCPDVPEKW